MLFEWLSIIPLIKNIYEFYKKMTGPHIDLQYCEAEFQGGSRDGDKWIAEGYNIKCVAINKGSRRGYLKAKVQEYTIEPKDLNLRLDKGPEINLELEPDDRKEATFRIHFSPRGVKGVPIIKKVESLEVTIGYEIYERDKKRERTLKIDDLPPPIKYNEEMKKKS